MAFDTGLHTRVAEALAGHPIAEKRMFGGVGFLLGGHLACGILKDDLIVRVGADRYAAALARDHVRVFDITGKVMKGWVMVAPEGVSEDRDLAHWVQAGVAFARTLPPK
ncbi:MAG: TfoX/Sxy family protein [Nitrospirota bacterium]|nr:TfoX/Sxy family protein [Nitrospirota bacterium]